MRSGDLLIIELLGLVLLTCLATVLGLGAAQILIDFLTAQFEAQAELLARIPDSSATRVSGALFDPILGFAPQLFGITLILTLSAALFPALSAARTDPAKIFSRP
jgi:ABC-type antimicrobial peptide transport system permease subunit